MTIRQRASATLKSDRNVIVAGWTLYAAFSGLLLLFNSAFWLYVAGLTVIYAISALGLDWIQGRAGQVSIGSAGFMAVGAFVAAVAVGDGVPSLLALVLAGIAGGLVGVLVGLPGSPAPRPVPRPGHAGSSVHLQRARERIRDQVR